MRQDYIPSGSTAVCALIPVGESRSDEPCSPVKRGVPSEPPESLRDEPPFTAPIYIANCGDSRAVLCRDGVPVVSTKDHKPSDPEERARAQAAGAWVTQKRINGLAVSRSLGDFDCKLDGDGKHTRKRKRTISSSLVFFR